MNIKKGYIRNKKKTFKYFNVEYYYFKIYFLIIKHEELK